jgi:hypothetical protein
LVSGSAIFFFDFTKSMKIILFKNKCLTVLYLCYICLDLLLHIVRYALLISNWLSQWSQINGTSFGQHKISSKKFQSHSTSSLALSREINFYSIMDLAMHIFLEDFHDKTTPPSMKTYSLNVRHSININIHF